MRSSVIMAHLFLIVLLICAIPIVTDQLNALAALPDASSLVLLANSIIPFIMVIALIVYVVLLAAYAF